MREHAVGMDVQAFNYRHAGEIGNRSAADAKRISVQQRHQCVRSARSRIVHQKLRAFANCRLPENCSRAAIIRAESTMCGEVPGEQIGRVINCNTSSAATTAVAWFT